MKVDIKFMIAENTLLLLIYNTNMMVIFFLLQKTRPTFNTISRDVIKSTLLRSQPIGELEVNACSHHQYFHGFKLFRCTNENVKIFNIFYSITLTSYL